MINKIDNLIVLQFSPTIKLFSVRYLKELLQSSLKALINEGAIYDWISIGIYPDRESCDTGVRWIVWNTDLNPEIKFCCDPRDFPESIWKRFINKMRGYMVFFGSNEKKKELFIKNLINKSSSERINQCATGPPKSNLTIDDILDGKSF